jgi:hypothetical protein
LIDRPVAGGEIHDYAGKGDLREQAHRQGDCRNHARDDQREGHDHDRASMMLEEAD